MKIATILGTRPEIIKLSPLIPLFDENFEHILIHTNQHYSPEMDYIFFKDLNLRKPDYFLNVGSGSQAYQVGNMMVKIEEILQKEKPEIVIVQGDTNSTLAGALVAAKLNIKLAHVESGCRSFNKKMPEEINRIIADHCSEILFAADEAGYTNLLREGIEKEKIFLTGSTATDALLRNLEYSKKSDIIEKTALPDNFVTVTLHRAENTNNTAVLKEIISALNEIAEKTTVVFPVHPRTKKFIEDNKIVLGKNIIRTEPLGYLDFIKLMSSSLFVMSDSGGIQEEAAILNIPCLILREETEWQRLVDAGKNIIAGTQKEDITRIAGDLLENKDKLESIKNIKIELLEGVSQKILEVLKNAR